MYLSNSLDYNLKHKFHFLNKEAFLHQLFSSITRKLNHSDTFCIQHCRPNTYYYLSSSHPHKK